MKVFRQLLVTAVAFFCVSSVAASSSSNAADLVTDLPGLTVDVPFKHYSGHLQLETKEKLFYWYTESQADPENDPIVLWLSGGPGCSSVGGFFTENGPFVVTDDLSVKVNRYSWNRNVNLVWLESPAGVGFSSPLQDASYYNDDTVASRTYDFIELFFEKYPELKGREFYITGESYAGIYIPYLVNLLVEKPLPDVNLKGFAIGNPFTDNIVDGNAYMDYYYSHAMISLESYEKMVQVCGPQIGCIYDNSPCSPECQEVLEEADASTQSNDLNPYFIYGDKCLLNNNQGSALFSKLKPLQAAQLSPTHRGDISVCSDVLTQAYLNLPEVQKAIHVTEPVNWADCNDAIYDTYTSSASSLPKYRNILGKDLKILIYSGDADSVVNFIGTERWIGSQGLKLHVTRKWNAWFGPDKQLAGYVQEYNGLTFKTVKGAGHLVPAVRPLHGLNLFECFVYGEEKCAEFTYPIDDDEIEAGLFALDLSSARHATALFTTATTSSKIWIPIVAACSVFGVVVAVIRTRQTKQRSEYQSIPSNV